MDRHAIRAQLLQILNDETNLTLTAIAEDASLRDSLGLDSLDLTSVIVAIEDHYEIELTRPELKDVDTVADLLNVIEPKVAVTRRAA
jgi:acyl carrier protein